MGRKDMRFADKQYGILYDNNKKNFKICALPEHQCKLSGLIHDSTVFGG